MKLKGLRNSEMTSRLEIHSLPNAPESDCDRTKYDKPTVESEVNDCTVWGFSFKPYICLFKEKRQRMDASCPHLNLNKDLRS